ncbi:MAG: hypothetical protein ABF870_09175, partial [Bifidobacterium aquikefiri]
NEIISPKPVVVRFDGNEAAEGLQILSQSGNPRIHVAKTMEEAAHTAARLAAQQSTTVSLAGREGL